MDCSAGMIPNWLFRVGGTVILLEWYISSNMWRASWLSWLDLAGMIPNWFCCRTFHRICGEQVDIHENTQLIHTHKPNSYIYTNPNHTHIPLHFVLPSSWLSTSLKYLPRGSGQYFDLILNNPQSAAWRITKRKKNEEEKENNTG